MKACTCGTDCTFQRGDLVCQYCGVPYEYARHPIDLTQTLISVHNRITMACGLCVQWFHDQTRKPGHPVPILLPPWSNK